MFVTESLTQRIQRLDMDFAKATAVGPMTVHATIPGPDNIHYNSEIGMLLVAAVFSDQIYTVSTCKSATTKLIYNGIYNCSFVFVT